MTRALGPLTFLLICAAAAAPAVAAQGAPEAGAPSAETNDWLWRNDGEGLLRFLLADGVFSEVESAQLMLGIERTCQIVTPLFEKAVKDLRPSWKRMFRPIASKFPYEPGNERRDNQLFFAVGMKAVDLLQPKVEAIVGPVFVESFKVDPEAIDYDAASDRLSEARAAGRASCGLREPASKPVGAKKKKNGVK